MNSANYLLIDGLLRPDAIKRLYQRGEPLVIKPLYLSTRWAGIKEQGPVLVQAEPPYKLIHEWRTSPGQHLDACAFYSPASAHTVADHLRHFVSPPDHLGQCSLLRFADPVVLHYWLSSYNADHLDQILGPVEQIWVPTPVHSWQPAPQVPFTHFVRQRPARAWEARFSLLGEPQLAALQQAFVWILKERLYDWLNSRNSETFAEHNGAGIDNWLERALDGARRWGLVSEVALVTWAELCQDWGLDFTEQPDTPYRRWAIEHPDQTRLAPEVRIEALDKFRIQAAKEATHD